MSWADSFNQQQVAEGLKTAIVNSEEEENTSTAQKEMEKTEDQNDSKSAGGAFGSSRGGGFGIGSGKTINNPLPPQTSFGSTSAVRNGSGSQISPVNDGRGPPLGSPEFETSGGNVVSIGHHKTVHQSSFACKASNSNGRVHANNALTTHSSVGGSFGGFKKPSASRFGDLATTATVKEAVVHGGSFGSSRKLENNPISGSEKSSADAGFGHAKNIQTSTYTLVGSGNRATAKQNEQNVATGGSFGHSKSGDVKSVGGGFGMKKNNEEKTGHSFGSRIPSVGGGFGTPKPLNIDRGGPHGKVHNSEETAEPNNATVGVESISLTQQSATVGGGFGARKMTNTYHKVEVRKLQTVKSTESARVSNEVINAEENASFSRQINVPKVAAVGGGFGSRNSQVVHHVASRNVEEKPKNERFGLPTVGEGPKKVSFGVAHRPTADIGPAQQQKVVSVGGGFGSSRNVQHATEPVGGGFGSSRNMQESNNALSTGDSRNSAVRSFGSSKDLQRSVGSTQPTTQLNSMGGGFGTTKHVNYPNEIKNSQSRDKNIGMRQAPLSPKNVAAERFDDENNVGNRFGCAPKYESRNENVPISPNFDKFPQIETHRNGSYGDEKFDRMPNRQYSQFGAGDKRQNYESAYMSNKENEQDGTPFGTTKTNQYLDRPTDAVEVNDNFAVNSGGDERRESYGQRTVGYGGGQPYTGNFRGGPMNQYQNDFAAGGQGQQMNAIGRGQQFIGGPVGRGRGNQGVPGGYMNQSRVPPQQQYPPQTGMTPPMNQAIKPDAKFKYVASKQQETDAHEVVPLPAEIALLNKYIQQEVKMMKDANIEIQRSDPSSPLHFIRSFKELRLKPEALQALNSLGFEFPTRIQETALPLLLMEPPSNLIAQAQSGTGKTAAFVLTMLCRIDVDLESPQCICLAPTLELAKQIGEVVEKMGKFMPKLRIHYAIKGGNMAAMRNIKLTEQIIIGTPGITRDYLLKYKCIDPATIKCLVLDEADIMIYQQGFSDISTTIYNMIEKESPKVQSMLFSATYDAPVVQFATKLIKNAIVVMLKKEEQALPNIKQFYVECACRNSKYAAIVNLYSGLTVASSVIFCHTKASVMWLYENMKARGHMVDVLHGDMTVVERANTINSFKKGQFRVLITTNVFARGIDVSQISVVINYDLPIKYNETNQPVIIDGQTQPDCETYLHRIGRTGRFGKSGIAINFIDSPDSMNMIRILEQHFKMEISKMDPSNLVELEAIDAE